MRPLFVLLALCGLCRPTLTAQTLTFHRSYGGSAGYDDARSIVPTNDGGFVFTGLCQSADDADGDLYLTKINAAGAVLWTKSYGRAAEDGGNHLLPTQDGGFLATGHTALTYGISCDGYVVKTDAKGQLQWYALVGTAFDDVCDAAVELEDGTFLVAGRTEDPVSHRFRVLLAGISSRGDVLYTRALPSEQMEVAYAMTRATDGHLLLAGYTSAGGPVTERMLLLKCTAEGQVIWRKSWQIGNWAERAHALVATPDGGCVVVGGGHDATYQPTQMVAIRCDALGKRTQATLLLSDAGPGNLTNVQITSEGHIVVGGTLQREKDTHAQPWVAWLDQNLLLLEQRTLSIAAACRTRCMALTGNGAVVIGGQVGVESAATDAFLEKIASPWATTGRQEVAATPLLLFPNPCHDLAYLKIDAPEISKILTLLTLDGRPVRAWSFAGEEYLIERGDLPTGTYLFTVRDKQGRQLAAGRLAVD